MTCEGQYNSQLFSSCPPIFIGHDANPPSEHLCQLVMLCGGKVRPPCVFDMCDMFCISSWSYSAVDYVKTERQCSLCGPES